MERWAGARKLYSNILDYITSFALPARLTYMISGNSLNTLPLLVRRYGNRLGVLITRFKF
jgi:hypothetical protein